MKNFCMIVLKTAVNAILTNAGLMAMFSGTFNFTEAGIIAMLKATLAVAAAREVVVWLPIVLKWSTTDADPSIIKPPAA